MAFLATKSPPEAGFLSLKKGNQATDESVAGVVEAASVDLVAAGLWAGAAFAAGAFGAVALLGAGLATGLGVGIATAFNGGVVAFFSLLP